MKASQDLLRVGRKDCEQEQQEDPRVLLDEMRGSTQHKVHTQVSERVADPWKLRDECGGQVYAVHASHAAQNCDGVVETRGAEEYPPHDNSDKGDYTRGGTARKRWVL